MDKNVFHNSTSENGVNTIQYNTLHGRVHFLQATNYIVIYSIKIKILTCTDAFKRFILHFHHTI